MKSILVVLVSFFAVTSGLAQTFQATIQPLPATGAGVTVCVKTPGTVTGKVSSLTITIAIPVSVGTRPVIGVDNSADPFIGYDVYNAVNQTFDGAEHYIYNVLGTGDVIPAGATKVFTGGVDVPMAVINFSGGAPGVSSQIKMANLPDGGTDPNPNSYFGFSVDGSDVVNLSAMFYGINLISTATNDGLGYSGTSFARTVPLVPLPISFLSFNALKKADNAQLDWSVQNESALTDRYEIERSFTGSDFKKIGTVAPLNNGNSYNSYVSTDYNLSSLNSSGKIYYRIKQVDRDGRFVHTEIRSVRLDGKTFDLSVYPNPVVSTTKLYLDLADAAQVKIKLIDAAGKVVQTEVFDGVKGLNPHPLNTTKLIAGTYMVQVEAGNQTRTIPVVKSK